MDMPIPNEGSPGEEKEESDGPRRPSSSRAVLDMKDRNPQSFQPFITFDFEPDDASSHSPTGSHNSAGRRRSRTSSRVAIDHFDREGVEHLRSRFSSASEYSTYLTENSGALPSTKVASRRGENVSERSAVDHRKRPGQCRKNVSRPREATSGIVSSADKMKGSYSGNQLAPFDLEAALRETIKQHDSRNAAHRTLGLGFRDLSVFGADRSLSSHTIYQPTLWSILDPIEWARKLIRMRKRVPSRIISGFEGVVNPGEMLLVLGRPSSGCSTLLKVLANQTKEFVHVLGERRYDALIPRDVCLSFRDKVWYCPEAGVYPPSLTVQQTIFFAAKTQMHDGHQLHDIAEEVAVTLMTIFGLRHIKDTLMGDNRITQAERRRVSICEAVATQVSVCCWDKPYQGLDACAALEFVQALRIATDLSAMTTIVALSQAGESLYQLFDKVCVIGDGRMLYYGRADAARSYFRDLGYDPLPRQATPDFLISVTDPAGRIQNPARPFSAPRTPEEFTRAFHRSPLGRTNRVEVANYWQENVDRASYSEHRWNIRLPKMEKSKIIQASISSWMHHLWDAMTRRYHALNNRRTPMIVQIFISILQGAFTGLAYWHSSEANESSVPRDGVLFIIMLFSMLSTMAESLEPNQFTLLQQTRAMFYRSSIEAIATTLFDIPLTFLTQSCLSSIIYALAGLRGSVFHFLSFLLYIVTGSTIKLLFRSITLLVTRETAYSAAGSIIVLLILFSGFVDLSSSVTKYARWLTWLDPLRYMFEGLIVNEYHDIGVPCTTYSPERTDYVVVSPLVQVCLTAASGGDVTSLNGDEYLEAKYGYSYSNLWIDFGFVLAFAVIFFGLFLLVSGWTSPAFGKSFTLFLRGTQDQGAKNDKPDVYRHIRRDRCVSEAEDDGQYEIPLNDVFAWKNLHYSVSRGKEQKVLLDGISGYVAPRKLCALVGRHGAGKTTLLNVLSGHYEQGALSGDVHLNGASLPSSFRSQVGFVQKTDTYYPKQTVREALHFSADLRQSTRLPQHEKDAYIDSCLKMCGLEEYSDAMIDTLSLENRKRASIGVELAAQPRLLFFLDEPTSGLDPQEALSIIALLRDLANHGQAILCSIHRPSSEILAHFDQLLVLHRGGKMVYFGDVGEDCGSMIDYFERNGARPCGSTENPIEWMMNAISADDHAYIPVDWSGKWLRSPEIAQLRRDVGEFQRKSQQSKCSPKQCPSSRSPTSCPHQTFLLLRRTFVTYWRNPGYLLAKLSINLLSGLFIGFTLYQSDNSLQGVQRKIFATFLLTIVCIPVSIQLQSVLLEARLVYERSERYCQMYSWTAFLASHTLVELFWNIVSSIIFFSAWYFATGFPLDRIAYSLLVIGFLYPLLYTTQALAVTSPSSSTKISSFLLCLSFSFTSIFDGVTAPSEHSLWQTWLYRTSPLTYLLDGFIGQALGNQLIQCSATEFFQLTPPSTTQTCSDYLETFIDKFGGYVDNPNSTEACQYCPARTTDEYLASRYNIQYGHRWRNVWIVLAACILNISLMFTLTYIFRIWRGRLSCAGRRVKT